MIKKYDDNYIDLSKVCAITKITQDYGYSYDGQDGQYGFVVYMQNNKISFTDDGENGLERLSSLRERLVKDWKEVRNERD